MKEKSYSGLIIALSIAVPALVALLYYIPKPNLQLGFDLKILPAFHATLNFTTALLLVAGLYFIKSKNVPVHKRCMLTAFSLSILFLISYVTYHSLAKETHFGGTGWVRPVYFFFLITHIILAGVIVPFVLITLNKALSEKFDQHRKIARITFPLWLYVAVTGVVVYLMLKPYY